MILCFTAVQQLVSIACFSLDFCSSALFYWLFELLLVSNFNNKSWSAQWKSQNWSNMYFVSLCFNWKVKAIYYFCFFLHCSIFDYVFWNKKSKFCSTFLIQHLKTRFKQRIIYLSSNAIANTLYRLKQIKNTNPYLVLCLFRFGFVAVAIAVVRFH